MRNKVLFCSNAREKGRIDCSVQWHVFQTFTGVACGNLLVRVRDGTHRLGSAMEQHRHGERGALQVQRVDEPVVRAKFFPIRGNGE